MLIMVMFKYAVKLTSLFPLSLLSWWMLYILLVGLYIFSRPALVFMSPVIIFIPSGVIIPQPEDSDFEALKARLFPDTSVSD